MGSDEMASIHIDFACTEKCWNLIDSYGEICIGCGCCSKDKKVRYESRIRCLERWLKEQYEFDYWIEGCEELQRKNIKSNIKYFKRRLRYYKKQLGLLLS